MHRCRAGAGTRCAGALVMLLVLGLDALRGGQVEKEEQEAPPRRIRPRARFLTDFPRSRERNKVVVRSGGPAQEPHASRFTHTLTPHTSFLLSSNRKHEKCRSSGPELAGLPEPLTCSTHEKPFHYRSRRRAAMLAIASSVAMITFVLTPQHIASPAHQCNSPRYASCHNPLLMSESAEDAPATTPPPAEDAVDTTPAPTVPSPAAPAQKYDL